MIGHPLSETQEVEAAMRFAAAEGARVMLSEFAPIPGTPDGELARKWIDLDESLHHNRTAFALRVLGTDRVNRLKTLCRELNSSRAPA